MLYKRHALLKITMKYSYINYESLALSPQSLSLNDYAKLELLCNFSMDMLRTHLDTSLTIGCYHLPEQTGTHFQLISQSALTFTCSEY